MRHIHRFSPLILIVAIACSPDATGPRVVTKVAAASSGALGRGSIAAVGVYDASLGTLPQAQGWSYNPGNPGNPPPTVSGGLLREIVTNSWTYWSEIEPSWIDQALQASGLSSFNAGGAAGRVLFGGASLSSRSVTELKSACYGTSSTDCLTDLVLSITPPLPTFTLNQTAVVNFRDSNIGTRPSTSAVLFVPASPGFKFVSATNATCGPASGGLSCALGGVAAGGQLNFSLTVKAVQVGTFPVTLTLTGQETDGNTANHVIVRNVTVH